MAKGPGFFKTAVATASQGIPNILQGIQGRRDRERQSQWRTEDIDRSEENRSEDQYRSDQRYRVEQEYRDAQDQLQASQKELDNQYRELNMALQIGDFDGVAVIKKRMGATDEQIAFARQAVKDSYQATLDARSRASAQEQRSVASAGYAADEASRAGERYTREVNVDNPHEDFMRGQARTEAGYRNEDRPLNRQNLEVQSRAMGAGTGQGMEGMMQLNMLENDVANKRARLAQLAGENSPEAVAESVQLEEEVSLGEANLNALKQRIKGFRAPEATPQGNRPAGGYLGAIRGRQAPPIQAPPMARPQSKPMFENSPALGGLPTLMPGNIAENVGNWYAHKNDPTYSGAPESELAKARADTSNPQQSSIVQGIMEAMKKRDIGIRGSLWTGGGTP